MLVIFHFLYMYVEMHFSALTLLVGRQKRQNLSDSFGELTVIELTWLSATWPAIYNAPQNVSQMCNGS